MLGQTSPMPRVKGLNHMVNFHLPKQKFWIEINANIFCEIFITKTGEIILNMQKDPNIYMHFLHWCKNFAGFCTYMKQTKILDFKL